MCENCKDFSRQVPVLDSSESNTEVYFQYDKLILKNKETGAELDSVRLYYCPACGEKL